jgi:hypothetical protein
VRDPDIEGFTATDRREKLYEGVELIYLALGMVQ